MQFRCIGTTDEVAQCAGGFICQTQEGRLPGLGFLQDGIGKVWPDGSKGDWINLLMVLIYLIDLS